MGSSAQIIRVQNLKDWDVLARHVVMETSKVKGTSLFQ